MRPEVVAGIGLRQLRVNVALNRNQVEYGRAELCDGAAGLVGYVARHGQRLQIDLRRHDGRAETQKHAVLQVGNCLGKDQEVAIAGGAQFAAVAIRMLMDDVIADP